MTSAQQQPNLSVATGTFADNDGAEDLNTGPAVAAADAEADAARSGADTDLDNAQTDSDGVPVGRADAAADAELSGADRDDVL